MPLTHVSLYRGQTPVYRRALLDGIYTAMRETFEVPEDDRFMTVTQYDPDDLVFGRSYLGIERSDEFVLVEIIASNTRDVRTKTALFKAIAEKLGRDPGVRPEDLLINLVEVRPENWSFGHGIAQYATVRAIDQLLAKPAQVANRRGQA